MTNYFEINSDFTCVHCRNYIVAGYQFASVQNRNHCPYCLWSRHLDLYKAGDRMSACKAPMQPIGLTLKRSHKKYGSHLGGELMLIHNCTDCERVSINRIAADDIAQVILEIFEASLMMEAQMQTNLQKSGIQLLSNQNRELVYQRLYGQAIQPKPVNLTTA